MAIFLASGISAKAQTITYNSNSLQIEVTVINPCDVSASNGSISIKLISSASGSAVVAVLSRTGTTILPNFNLSTSGVDTYTYVPSAPQNDNYDFIVTDPSTPSDVVNTFLANVNGLTISALNVITIGTGTKTNNSNCVTPNGQLAATVTGGSAGATGSFTYTWTADNALAGLPLTGTWNGVGSLNLATLLSTSGLPKGTYSLLLEDDLSNCSASKDFTITEELPALFNLTTSTPAICLGSTATLLLSNSNSSNVTYTVFENGVSTGIQKTGTSAALSFTIPGSRLGVDGVYNYTIEASSGICEPKFMNGTAAITVSTAVTITSATPTNPLCFEQSSGSINISASGGSGIYQYSKDGGLTFSGTSTIDGLPAGSYDVVAKDNAGCASTITITTLTDPPQLTISSASIVPETCPGSADASIVIGAAGGTPAYQYSGDNGSTFGAAATLTGLAPDTYLVVVKDVNNCTSSAATVEITGVDPIQINGTPTDPTTCVPGNNGVIDLSATGGTGPYTFNFDGGGFSSTTNYSNLSAGSYAIEVQDVNGCSPDPITLTLTAASISFTTEKTMPTCNGDADGIITFSASGGNGNYSFSIDNGLNYFPSTDFTGLTAGVYQVKAQDNSGCEKSGQVILGEPALISYNKGTVNATCSNDDGSVTIASVSGGTAPYTFEFDSAPYDALPAGGIFSALPAGTYGFIVTDDLGCTKTENFIITKPASITSSTVMNSPDCVGNGTNGSIDLVIVTPGSFQTGISTSNVTPPANFLTINSTGIEVNPFENLKNGVYFITIQSETLCPSLIPVIVSGGPEAVDFNYAATNKLCFEDTQASVELSAFQGYLTLPFICEVQSGGIPVITRTITPVEAQDKVTIDIPTDGTYDLVLYQDQSVPTGCPLPVYSTTESFIINSPQAPLDTISTSIKISLPELPTGSLSGVLLESRYEPYQVKLELIAPTTPGNSFLSDFVQVSLDPTSSYFEFNYSSLYAGLYTLTLKDDFGCVKTYPLQIGADPTLVIPNIFTPNDDDINETFFIRNLPPSSQLSITNRWGGKVYESNNYQNDWSAKGVPDGIYYYKLKFSGKTFTGWLEVLSER